MLPAIKDGDILLVEPIEPSKLKPGHIVLFRKKDGFKAHRIVGKRGEFFITQGDAGMTTDGEIRGDQILGKIVARENAETGRLVDLAGSTGAKFFIAQLRKRVAQAVLRRVPLLKLISMLLFFFAAESMYGQVAVDTVTTGTQNAVVLTGISLSVAHTTSGSNRLMVVGISMNTAADSLIGPSHINTISYNGSSLTNIFVTTTNNRRVEMWYLAAPTVGTANVVISGTAGGAGVGISAGVITFTGVDQTLPIRASNSAAGTSSTPSVTVASSKSDMVLDTLSVIAGTTVTTPSPQTSAWNASSSGGLFGNNVVGVGSSCTGGSCTGTLPTVTMSESLSASTAWTIGVISIRAFGADLSITKAGSPEPVLKNTTLTYTLTIKNNGLQSAPGVLVSDVLPTQVSFVSVTQSQGSCAQAAGTVSCVLGAMASTATATVTIVTTAITPSLAVNTAVVSPTAVVDPDLTNNTATFTSTITFPNSVRLNSFTAVPSAKGTLLSWNSGGELHNLGFNVYRDVNGQKVKLNSSLIAGSALLMRDTVEQHAAKTYRWIDSSQSAGGLYWLEDVDLNGSRTLHGPVALEAAPAYTATAMPRSAMIQDLATSATPARSDVAITQNASPVARVRESVVRFDSRPVSGQTGFELAAAPAVKIYVDHEGWYRVTQTQLAAAGLSANTNAKLLHLYAEGVEQPIRITGGERFGSQSAIEFYGTPIDTPYSGQRVYWLAAGRGPGLRIADAAGAGSPGPPAQSFMQTLELKPRTTYFGTLLRDNIDNFFGPLVSSVAESETVNVANLASGEAKVAVALQGLTDGQQHTVTVMLNGSTLGELNFANQNEGREEFQIPSGVLTNGSNTVTLLAQGGDNDFSLVNTIDVTFPHTFTAESDMLKFTADAGESVSIAGFSQPPSRLIDITNPLQPLDLQHDATVENGAYTLGASVPWTTPGQHTLLALSDSQLAIPVALAAHHPSNLHSVQAGAEYVVLTAPQFAAPAQPLASLHQSEGKTVAMVNVDDVYDEFNFGERTPFAIRSFLKTATEAWKNKPKYLLFVGDASVDPRDYLGFGSFDFVPTRIVPTAELMTASDDWFSDFENTGSAKIATGRLPARTQDDAQTMVAKIIGYARGTPSTWNSHALMVADTDDPTMSFSQQSLAVQNLLPQTVTATDVFAGTLGTATASQNIVDGINNGQLLVNYNGHGSVEVWAGGGLFNDTQAAALTNGSKLPLFVIMNCLNGFFQDVYTQSMAEALMLAPNGGAVAVWASSGLTAPDPQFAMDRKLAQDLFSTSALALGDAVLAAKSSISDQDVRKTFILFGDPAMRLQVPQSNSTAAPKPVSGALVPIHDTRPSAPRRLNLGKPDIRTME
jgi:uncharacterized repeat protein (TIGR01451 family)